MDSLYLRVTRREGNFNHDFRIRMFANGKSNLDFHEKGGEDLCVKLKDFHSNNG